MIAKYCDIGAVFESYCLHVTSPKVWTAQNDKVVD